MLESMRKTLCQEADAINNLAQRLNSDFEQAANWMLECEGRVVTSGIGKAGDIAKKSSSTLSSTGTPSLFLHPADAVHGDLGMVTKKDIVLLYTNSGETEEILRLFPPLREIGCKSILITGRPLSTASKHADLTLDSSVEHEACPHDLAPTTSTTVMLALSDALALAVMEARQFTKAEYALYHPSGALGRRLLMRVRDAMRRDDEVAFVTKETPFLEVLKQITRAGTGAAIVKTEDGRLAGLITDGDVRRRLETAGQGAFAFTAKDLMTEHPSTLEADAMAVEALDLFESIPIKIGEIPVLDGDQVVGLVMLKDLVRLGLS